MLLFFRQQWSWWKEEEQSQFLNNQLLQAQFPIQRQDFQPIPYVIEPSYDAGTPYNSTPPAPPAPPSPTAPHDADIVDDIGPIVIVPILQQTKGQQLYEVKYECE